MADLKGAQLNESVAQHADRTVLQLQEILLEPHLAAMHAEVTADRKGGATITGRINDKDGGQVMAIEGSTRAELHELGPAIITQLSLKDANGQKASSFGCFEYAGQQTCVKEKENGDAIETSGRSGILSNRLTSIHHPDKQIIGSETTMLQNPIGTGLNLLGSTLVAPLPLWQSQVTRQLDADGKLKRTIDTDSKTWMWWPRESKMRTTFTDQAGAHVISARSKYDAQDGNKVIIDARHEK